MQQSLNGPSSDKRRLADYAMALDLVRVLAANLDEKEVIENILDIFSMLFAPSYLVYLEINDSIPGRLYSGSGVEFHDSATVKRLSLLKEPYEWQPSGSGFMLQVRFDQELLGVISIDGIAFPEYKQEYLDLSFFLVQVFGMAIINARRYAAINLQKARLESANRELERREQYYRSFFEDAPLGYQSMDADGNLLDVNREWSKISGYSAAEVAGRWFGDLLTKESAARFQSCFPEILESGKVDDLEFDMRKKNGEILKISFIGKVLRDAEENLVGIHAVLRDITRRKEILKLLREDSKDDKNLKDFISICASCSKIRDHGKEGDPWVSPAEYFMARLPGLRFSHGLCPGCMKKLYPEFIKEKG